MTVRNGNNKLAKLFRSDRFQKRIRTLTFPGFEGVPVYNVIQRFRHEIKEDALSIRASSISFFFILALFPSIIFFFSLIPYIPIKHFDQSVIQLLGEILPPGVFLVLRSTIQDIVSIQRGGLLSINFLLAIFIASNGVNSIMRAFDKMNHTFRERTFWEKRGTSLKILFLVNLQLIIAVLMIIKGKEFIALILMWMDTDDTYISTILHIVKILLTVFSFFNIYALIYYYGPSVKKKYRFYSIGATFATLFSIIFSYAFRAYTMYLNNFNRLYGSLGILIVVMLWIYLNAIVLLFGFELNNSIAVNKTQPFPDEEEKGI